MCFFNRLSRSYSNGKRNYQKCKYNKSSLIGTGSYVKQLSIFANSKIKKESTVSVIDNEKHRTVKGYMWCVRDALHGSV